LRSQVLKIMSWKPYLKISQVFLGLGNPECKQVSKNWGSHVLKIMSKKFPGLGLGNPHCVRPKIEISHPENHVLKNSMSRFWWTPQVQANSRWPKIETVKNALFNVFKWVISEERAVTGRIFQALPTHCPHRQTPSLLLLYIRYFILLLFNLFIEKNWFISFSSTWKFQN